MGKGNGERRKTKQRKCGEKKERESWRKRAIRERNTEKRGLLNFLIQNDFARNLKRVN